MARRIKPYAIGRLNGTTKLKVPEGAAVINAIALENTDDVVQVLVAEEALYSKGTKFETIELLVFPGTTAFGEPPDGKMYQYVGSVVWDNGYRVHHVFQILGDESEADPDIELSKANVYVDIPKEVEVN